MLYGFILCNFIQNKQANKQTNKQATQQTNAPTNKQTNMQTNKQTNKPELGYKSKTAWVETVCILRVESH